LGSDSSSSKIALLSPPLSTAKIVSIKVSKHASNQAGSGITYSSMNIIILRYLIELSGSFRSMDHPTSHRNRLAGHFV
jgi:hypothetical protein